MVGQQHGMQRVIGIKRYSGQGLHIAAAAPSTLPRRRERKLNVLVTGSQSALLHVQQPERVGRVHTHKDVIATVKSHAHNPVRGEATSIASSQCGSNILAGGGGVGLSGLVSCREIIYVQFTNGCFADERDAEIEKQLGGMLMLSYRALPDGLRPKHAKPYAWHDGCTRKGHAILGTC